MIVGEDDGVCWEYWVVWIDVISVFGCLFNSIYFFFVVLLVERIDDDRLMEVDVVGVV